MLKTRFVGALMILAILLTACGVKAEDAITGIWEGASNLGNGYMEFTPTGILRTLNADGSFSIGIYQFTDSNTVQISLAKESESAYSVDVGVSGDILTIIGEGGSARLTRVK